MEYAGRKLKGRNDRGNIWQVDTEKQLFSYPYSPFLLISCVGSSYLCLILGYQRKKARKNKNLPSALMTPHYSLPALFLVKTLICPEKKPTKSLPVVVQYGITENIEPNKSVILQQTCRPPVVFKAFPDRHRWADGQELHRMYMYMYICAGGTGVREGKGEKAQSSLGERNKNRMGEINFFVRIKSNIIQTLGLQMKMHC